MSTWQSFCWRMELMSMLRIKAGSFHFTMLHRMGSAAVWIVSLSLVLTSRFGRRKGHSFNPGLFIVKPASFGHGCHFPTVTQRVIRIIENITRAVSRNVQTQHIHSLSSAFHSKHDQFQTMGLDCYFGASSFVLWINLLMLRGSLYHMQVVIC